MEAFTEKQSFGKRWWWILLLPLVIGGIVSWVALVKENPVIWKGVFPLFITVIPILMLWRMNMHSLITEEGVGIKFTPFQRNWKWYKWSDVELARVVTYSPLTDYGGWGIRKGWRKSKVAYNVWGDEGLELTFHDGNVVMIGTSEPERMSTYLQYLKRKYQLAALN